MSEYSGRSHSNPQEALWYWIEERERVRLAKEAGKPRPWSRDPVFQQTYFCNVNREDDRVTRWIRKYWNVKHPNYDFAMCAARLFNWPDTMEAIGFPDYDPFMWIGDMQRELEAESARGTKIWGSAYVVTTHGLPMSKLDYASKALRGAATHLCFGVLQGTCAGAHSALQRLEGFGSFMAAQVVADLKNTAWHPLAEASDWWTFSAPGPGSLRGLSWYFGHKVTPGKYQEHMKILMDDFNVQCEGNSFLRDNIKPILCMQNLQNCLCEYDKYMRVATGSGRSKRGYNGA